MRAGFAVPLIATALLAGGAPAQPLRGSPKAATVFRDCGDCPEMVVIPAGHFAMGGPAAELGTSAMEQPVHRVAIRSFAAGRFDVTRGEWKRFARATHRPTRAGCAFTGRPGPFIDKRGSWQSLGFAQTDHHPVVCITWQDAKDYAAWLSKRTGRHYRLLSEAEWEYAARAGASTVFPWGDKADRSRANYGPDKGYGKGMIRGPDRWLYTSPVGAFPPNRFGLYDMTGNVLQFVEDCLSGSYAGAPVDGSAADTGQPLVMTGDVAELSGMPSCQFRMARGGDWGDPPELIRPAFRNFAPVPPIKLQDFATGGLGFRLARDLR
jgi:formylglycine-generating enzyme required for sulfatase activity